MSRRYGFLTLLFCAWALVWGGCTSTPVQPLPILPETPPPYVKVPHPEGLDLADLMAIFTDKEAPSPDSLTHCDDDFKKLMARTQSQDEINQGARELVLHNPVGYHWCFYGKLLQMDEELKSDLYLDQREKRILDTYLFLTPIAHAFLDDFQDSRYLRWAIARYRRLSEYVFYRKVELSPQAASELTTATNPFGMLRPVKDAPASVLAKYGIVPAEPAGAASGSMQSTLPTTAPPTAEVYPADESATGSRAPASSPSPAVTPPAESAVAAPASSTPQP